MAASSQEDCCGPINRFAGPGPERFRTYLRMLAEIQLGRG